MLSSLSAPVEVYLLALVPALLWGFQPVFSKRGMSAGGGTVQASMVVVVVDSALYWLAILGVQAWQFLQGAAFDPLSGLDARTLAIFVVAGVVGTSLGRLAVFAGVERLGASINSAVISTRPLFATALAVGFLNERVTLATVAGVVVLAVGLATLALAKGGDISGWDRSHLAYPIAAATCFAGGNVLRRYGLRRAPVDSLSAVAINETAALLALGAFVVATGRASDLRDAPRRTYALFAGSGTITAVALLSLFAALQLPAGRVVLVDPLTATAPLFTSFFAYFLLDDLEAVTRGVVTGAALVVAGAVLVTVA